VSVWREGEDVGTGKVLKCYLERRARCYVYLMLLVPHHVACCRRRYTRTESTKIKKIYTTDRSQNSACNRDKTKSLGKEKEKNAKEMNGYLGFVSLLTNHNCLIPAPTGLELRRIHSPRNSSFICAEQLSILMTNRPTCVDVEEPSYVAAKL
jgi:hypothetical protein